MLASEEPAASVFHSQQAVEKSAKAFLAFHNVRFRRTHDIQELGLQCLALSSPLAALLAEADYLTDYAVAFRYLDAPREPDREEAQGALETARHLHEHVRSILAK
jgi:HEPN domain-containing protein